MEAGTGKIAHHQKWMQQVGRYLFNRVHESTRRRNANIPEFPLAKQDDVKFIESFAATMIQKTVRGMQTRKTISARRFLANQQRAKAYRGKSKVSQHTYHKLECEEVKSIEGQTLLQVKGIVDIHEGRCDNCKHFRQEDLGVSEVFSFYKDRCCCCGAKLVVTRQMKREQHVANHGANRIRSRKEQTEYLRKRLLPAPVKPTMLKSQPKQSFLPLLAKMKSNEGNVRWPGDDYQLPSLEIKIKKKKRKISAKAQRRSIEELAAPPIRAAITAPEHSPFGFGGSSPRDIQVLVGFRKPLPRTAAAAYGRRKTTTAGLTRRQLASLDLEEDQSASEAMEEDEFSRQLRLHAERRQRNIAEVDIPKAMSKKLREPQKPAVVSSLSPRARTAARRCRNRKKPNDRDFFASRASKNPGKLTKSAYRREVLPTRHKRQGKQLQRLNRERLAKPSMLFRVLADEHSKLKMRQQA